MKPEEVISQCRQILMSIRQQRASLARMNAQQREAYEFDLRVENLCQRVKYALSQKYLTYEEHLNTITNL